jgi:hypothetical protein
MDGGIIMPPNGNGDGGTMASLKKIPKPVLYGGAAVLGLGAFLWYRHQAAASASPGTVADTSSVPDSSGFNVSDAGAGDGGANVAPFTTVPVLGTNEAWEQEAISALSNSGFSTHVAGLAISRVLGGLVVTPEQEQIFLQAVGLLGPPPAGYPVPIKVQGGPAPPTGERKAVRRVAAGTFSLDQVAHRRGTSTDHLITVSRAHLGKTNLARFNKYVHNGTSRKMPPGLVYYTSN